MIHKPGYVAVLLVLTTCLFAASAAAQVQTGSILVKAVDQQGAVLPGVTVTVTSPVLPSAIEGVTDTGGVYRFPSLTPGTYSVKATLSGFETIIRNDVIVQQSQTANLSLTMKVGAVSTEVTVTGEAPVVDSRTVGSTVNITSTLLDKTPGGKDIWSILEYKAPGVTIDAGNPPDVGGNEGGLQRSMSARGTPNGQNTQMLNGVNVNDPAAQGYSMNYYIPSAFQNVEVSTSAEDISVGTGGVFINMVSKSGSNRFTGEALQTYQGKRTEATNVDGAQQQAGLAPAGNVSNLITNSNFQLGGPLVKNKLFFFGSGNYQATHVSVLGFPALPPSQVPTQLANTSTQDTTDIAAGEGKITFQPTGRHRFEAYLSKQRYDKPNRGAAASNTQDSDWKELDTFVIAQLSWNYTMSDRMFLDTKISYNNTHFPLMQKTDLQPLRDSVTSILYRNNTADQRMFRRRVEVVSNWQYFLPRLFGGRHEFKAGFDNGYTPETVDVSRAGNVLDTFTSTPTPTGSQVTLYNSPYQLQRAVTTTAVYAQDAYSIHRLTAIGGIRWERVEGYLPAQSNPAAAYFPAGTVFSNVTIGGTLYPTYTVQQNFNPVHGDPLWKNAAPRMALTYDLTGHGSTVAKFSVGKYLDQISTGTPPNPNGSISQTYNWNDTNGNLIFDPGTLVWNSATNSYSGGELGTLRSTSIPNPNGFFNKSLKRPSRNELSVSLDHQLMPDVLLTVAYYHTREHNNQGTEDQNMALWSSLYTPVTLIDPGPDGVLGTSDDRPITVYNLNAGAVTSNTTVNDDRLATHYNGLEIILNKRYSHGTQFLLSYDYSHTRQDLLGLANPNQVYVNAGGESGGRRHIFKFSGSYDLPYHIEAAANVSLQSGLPFTRTWTIPGCSGTVTTNCLSQGSTTVNVEPRGSEELPWLNRLDLRFGRTFQVGTNRFDLSLDIYNVFNSNTVYQVNTSTGLITVRPAADPTQPVQTIASFNVPQGVLAPRILRFNVTYSFGGR